jgi:hypothetical protein
MFNTEYFTQNKQNRRRHRAAHALRFVWLHAPIVPDAVNQTPTRPRHDTTRGRRRMTRTVTPHGDAVLRDDTTAPRARGFSYRIVSRPVTALGLALHFFHSVASQFSRRPSPSSSIPPGSGLAARSAVPPSAVRPFPYINHAPFLRKAFVRIRVSS